MTAEVTLLLLNAGRRVELLRAFRDAFSDLGVDGRIITTDVNKLAPAFHLGDLHRLLPRSREPGFLDALCDVCHTHRVDLIVPLIDPDLPVLASNQSRIEESGARVLISCERAVAICEDKEETHRFLSNRDLPVPTLFDQQEVTASDAPFFVKPRRGSGSDETFRADSLNELQFFAEYVSDPVVLDFVKGEEVTTDVFSDWSGEPRCAVPRTRIKVRGGEVNVGRVDRSDALESLCLEIARQLGTVGPINIQAILSSDGPRVIEVNPRFGGGVPLSIAAGAPLARWTVELALGREIETECVKVEDGLTMMRFDDSIFKPWSGLRA